MELNEQELRLVLDALQARINQCVLLHKYTQAHSLAVLRDKIWEELEKVIT